jgi:hypothetical protein
VEALSYLKELTVGDVKAAPLAVPIDTTAYDALVTMMLEDQGTVFVVDEEGFLAGVVSRRDLLRLSLGRTDLNNVPVGLIMTRVSQVITVTPCRESIFTCGSKTQLTTYRVEVSASGTSLPVTPVRSKSLLGRISQKHHHQIVFGRTW